MDAAERRGQLADVGELYDWWQLEIAPKIRKAITEAERISPEAAKLITAAIDPATATIEERKPS